MPHKPRRFDSTNVLILGKSGVGKSSLLNYLLGHNSAEIGVARPTTEKGIFVHPPMEVNGLNINIYDSWGLEADKADEWRELISTELRQRDCGDIRDWFHTILYCVDAKTARLEKFETEKIIEPLIAGGNHICFVLTKADVASEDELSAMKEILSRYSGVWVVPVSSVAQKLRTGRVTERFGRDELISAICLNMWDNLCAKIPRVALDNLERELGLWRVNLMKYYDEKSGRFGLFKNYRKVMEAVNERGRQGLRMIFFRQGLWLGETIRKALGHVALTLTGFRSDSRLLAADIGPDFSREIFQDMIQLDWSDSLASFFSSWPLVPVATAVLGPVLKSSYRGKLEEGLNEKAGLIMSEMEEQMKHLEKVLRGSQTGAGEGGLAPAVSSMAGHISTLAGTTLPDLLRNSQD
ncbi:hypothetical protein C4J81_03320 [Deltaproteobacteria bacterium Smac51]|nr:hypothetical protein C4J81_03320 [Deltaproteobacteria bacterium Smac51]